MSRPGVEVYNRTAVPARGVESDTGVFFMGGISPKGPTDKGYELNNMADFERIFGTRSALYATTYDAADAFFREGGTRLVFTRAIGPAAAVDTVALNGAGAAAAIAVDSWGQADTNITMSVVAGTLAGTFVLVVFDNAVEVERSYDLADPAAAVGWALNSGYIRVRATGAVNPIVQGPTALAAGTDDRANITDTQRLAAINRIPKGKGPGQVAYPGSTTATMQDGIVNHAKTNHRFALLDGADTSSNTTLASAADAVRASANIPGDGPSYAAIFAPWIVVPGVVTGTSRTIPPTAIAAALIARNDGATGNPNEPAAGANGETRYSIDLSQPEWTDAVREALNTKGVNVFRTVQGRIRLYGYRTLTETYDTPNLPIGSARTRMAVSSRADGIGEQFLFKQIDGRGRTIAEFAGALTGMLHGFWQLGALYGESPEEAFLVETGPSVNTVTTLGNNELRAVIAMRTSPFGELVRFEIVAVPVTQSL